MCTIWTIFPTLKKLRRYIAKQIRY
jgi:hypothetical protein